MTVMGRSDRYKGWTVNASIRPDRAALKVVNEVRSFLRAKLVAYKQRSCELLCMYRIWNITLELTPVTSR